MPPCTVDHKDSGTAGPLLYNLTDVPDREGHYSTTSPTMPRSTDTRHGLRPLTMGIDIMEQLHGPLIEVRVQQYLYLLSAAVQHDLCLHDLCVHEPVTVCIFLSVIPSNGEQTGRLRRLHRALLGVRVPYTA